METRPVGRGAAGSSISDRWRTCLRTAAAVATLVITVIDDGNLTLLRHDKSLRMGVGITDGVSPGQWWSSFYSRHEHHFTLQAFSLSELCVCAVTWMYEDRHADVDRRIMQREERDLMLWALRVRLLLAISPYRFNRSIQLCMGISKIGFRAWPALRSTPSSLITTQGRTLIL